MGVTLRQIPRGLAQPRAVHIQNVNALHSRIRGWFRPFKEVATNNLPLYLARFDSSMKPTVARALRSD